MRLVVLTGAGISAESGVPTFRDAGGLWEGHRVEDVATPEAFDRDPDTVQRFYDLRRHAVAQAEPNPAHDALARLERELGDDLLVVTQNIDDLHERAGSERVVHMHGDLLLALLRGLRRRVPVAADLIERPAVPRVRRADAAPRRRVVRRDAVRPRRHRRGAARLRRVRRDRHLGRRVSRRGVRHDGGRAPAPARSS